MAFHEIRFPDNISRGARGGPERRTQVTVAEDMLRLLPRGTHDPAMFIKPAELRAAMQGAGLVPGAITGLGPRGINRRFDLTFGPLPLTAILYMGVARKPAAPGAAP